MLTVTYAAATQEDAAVIFDLSKALIDQYEDINDIDYNSVLTWVKNKINNHIEQYVCVYYNDKKAGFYRLCHENGELELDDFYVLPEFRNMGIGTTVLKKCLNESRDPVFLYVFSKNEKAIALYKRFGFYEKEKVSHTRLIMCRD